MGKLEYKQIIAQLSPKQIELYDTYRYLLNADERQAEKDRNKEHIDIIESLASERIQKAALLAACKLAEGTILDLIDDLEPSVWKEIEQDIELKRGKIKSAIEQAGEGA